MSSPRGCSESSQLRQVTFSISFLPFVLCESHFFSRKLATPTTTRP